MDAMDIICLVLIGVIFFLHWLFNDNSVTAQRQRVYRNAQLMKNNWDQVHAQLDKQKQAAYQRVDAVYKDICGTPSNTNKK